MLRTLTACMTDKRKHRGPHPADAGLFSDRHVPAMRTAVSELSWLLDRGYAITSSLKLVGDRHTLLERQRTAVKRSACSTTDQEARQVKRIDPAGVPVLWIDGFNLITTIEAALAGGVIIVGRDGCYRDMASMHGTYRRVEETAPALQMIGRFLAEQHVGVVRWMLDQPVSNSGRLATMMREMAETEGWDWSVELVRNPDSELVQERCSTIVSADSMILDHCSKWVNLAALLVPTIGDAWLVDLRE